MSGINGIRGYVLLEEIGFYFPFRNILNNNDPLIFWSISEKVDIFLRIQGGQGVEDSSEMPINYKDLNVWQKSYQLYLDIYKITKGFPKEERYNRCGKDAQGTYKIIGKQTLEPLNPRILFRN
jgi:hypothetical protein